MTRYAATSWFWQAWLAALVFVFPIPHTIALRNLLLALGLVALLVTCRKSLPQPAPWLKPVAWWLLALTTWIVFHSVAVASASTFALDQFRANWMMPLLMGALAAWAAMQAPRERVGQAATFALAAHMVWLLGWQFTLWLSGGDWPFKSTPFGAYDFQGTLNSYLLALLVADRVAWLQDRYSPLGLGMRVGWALVVLTLLSGVALQSRNSSLVSLSLLAVGVLAASNGQPRARRLVVIAIGVATLIVASSLKFDNRWQGMRESVVVGWSSSDPYWRTGDGEPWQSIKRPATPSGAPLETSAYLRIAWTRESLEFLAKYPFGIGFGHDAFGRAIALKYGHFGMGSSHSGWLDFALGTGWPGLALLLATAGAALRCGWREFRDRQDAHALLLAFFVGGYMLRCLLDGHLSGWRLGLFAFITGVLIAAIKSPKPQT